MFNTIILALSSSIDSLGIGITYGLRGIKLNFLSKLILFIISILITSLAIFIGNNLNYFLPKSITALIGSLLLILMGTFILIEVIKKDKTNPIASVLDNPKKINIKESFYLGIALSIDSFCIGIGGSILEINTILFPILVSTFQILFLSIGRFLAFKIGYNTKFPNSVCELISGILLIFIGITKFFI